MRSTNNIFHLAIPCSDLDKAAKFYEKLGCTVARRMEDRITLNFFGDQVVCHYFPEKIDTDPEMYPRHFGLTFQDEADFDNVLKHAQDNNLEFFCEPKLRFQNREDEHRFFFLKDPSNNLLEFKYYKNPDMMY